MSNITRERFEEIFKETESEWKGDNAFKGLQIISDYFEIEEGAILVGTGKDVIYSVDIDEIVDLGITEEDAEKLAKLNWMIDEDFHCLACFV